MRQDRRRGALLGLAVGDALGTTYEFERLEQAAYPALATAPARDVVGGGPFALAAGVVTDDTQMAVCLARTLASPPLALDELAARYVAWTEHAFDIGNQTAAALQRIAAGASPREAGHDVWRASGRRAAGNGSLMRTAPIGVALQSGPVVTLIDAAIADSLITHADPRCALACAAFDAAIAHACEGGRDLIGVARTALATGAQQLSEMWADPDDRDAVARGAADLGADLDAASAATPGVHRPGLDLYRTAGFVRVAFRLAFWHAEHTPSWRAAVVDVASRGGDADTNAAIVGALLGARDGASAIPSPWVDRVLAAELPGPAVWADAHHPKHLLELV